MENYHSRKLFKQGNSLVVTIPNEIKKQLGFKEGTEVKLQVEKDYLLIQKSKDGDAKKR